MEQTFSDKIHVLFEKHGNNKCSVKTEKGAVLGEGPARGWSRASLVGPELIFKTAPHGGP